MTSQTSADPAAIRISQRGAPEPHKDRSVA